MSELGNNINNLRRQGSWKSRTLEAPIKPIGIKTPLEKGTSHGESLFKMHFDIVDQIQDNLKNLIMTQKGERLGFPDYGTNLRVIYSNTSLDNTQIADYASNEISNVVSKYMPAIKLLNFYSDIASNDTKNNASNNLGLEFSEAQSSIDINDSEIIELNSKNPNIDSVYKIIIEYNIPLLNKDTHIVLFINNSK